MATVTTDPAGNQAPSGGFKNLGWYSGYQYYNGSFGAKGAIHPQSPQQGAGQPVSQEVNNQSAAAQGKTPQEFSNYIAAPSTKVVNANPSASTPDAQSILDGFQSSASTALGNMSIDTNKTDEQIMAEVKGELLPTTQKPTPPNLVQTYQQFTASMGVDDLNNQAASLKSQIAAIQSQSEAQSAAEEAKGGTVPLNVIAGRQTEEQRQNQVKLDSLNLQLGVVTDQINTKYNMINTLMQFTQQDYTNALSSWQAEFDVNAKIYDAFTTAKQNQTSLALEVQKAASANFQTIANLVASGNMPAYNQMTPDQQAQVSKIETQAGLPIGTLASIQMSAKDRMLYTSQYRGQVQVITQDQNGQLNFQTFGQQQALGASASDKQSAIEQAATDAQNGASLEQLTSIYAGVLSPTEIKDIYNNYH